MTWPNIVLVSMLVVVPVSVVVTLVVATIHQRAPTVLRVAPPVLAVSAAVGVVVWIVLRVSAFGYWMSGNGPEPTRVTVAGVIGTVAAIVGWVALVGSVVIGIVGRPWRRSSPLRDGRP